MKHTIQINWNERKQVREELRNRGYISSVVLSNAEKLYQLGIDYIKVSKPTILRKFFIDHIEYIVIELKDNTTSKYWYKIEDLKKLFPLERIL